MIVVDNNDDDARPDRTTMKGMIWNGTLVRRCAI